MVVPHHSNTPDHQLNKEIVEMLASTTNEVKHIMKSRHKEEHTELPDNQRTCKVQRLCHRLENQLWKTYRERERERGSEKGITEQVQKRVQLGKSA